MAVQAHIDESLEQQLDAAQQDVARRVQAFIRIMGVLAEEGLLAADPGDVYIRKIALNPKQGWATMRLQSIEDIEPGWFLKIGQLAALLDVSYTADLLNYVVRFRRPSWKIPPD